MIFDFRSGIQRALYLPFIAVAMFVIGGCRTVDGRSSTEAATALIANRSAVESVGVPLDDAEALPWAETGTLSRDTAVAMALRRNPAIAADFARIREAHADLVQAGLLPNPVLGVSLGIEPGGNVGQISASLSQLLSALWQRPAREAVADAQLQQTILRVSHDALEVAAETQRRHRRVVHHQQMLDLFDERLTLTQRMIQAARDRVDVGLGHALDITPYERDQHRLQLEREQTASELTVAKQRLLEAMGMAGASTQWQAEPEAFAGLSDATEAEAITIGLAARLDVQAAQWAVTADDRALALQRRSRWPELTLGVEFEREDGVNRIGPAAGLELPLFDQGQARLASAHARLDRRFALHKQVVQQATRELREAWTTATNRQRQLDYHDHEVLSHAEAAVDRARAAFETGDADRLDVLHAERERLNARQNRLYTQLVRDLAWIDYKQATGWTLEDETKQHPNPGS